MAQKETFLTIEEAEEALGVSHMTIYKLFREGKLRKFGRTGTKRIFVSSEDVEKAKQFEEK